MVLRVYVDTSVIGGCLDEESAEPSQALLGIARQGRMILERLTKWPRADCVGFL